MTDKDGRRRTKPMRVYIRLLKILFNEISITCVYIYCEIYIYIYNSTSSMDVHKLEIYGRSIINHWVTIQWMKLMNNNYCLEQ